MANIGQPPEGYEPPADGSIDGYPPLPSGRHEVVINDSQWRDTKAGTGEYLELELLIDSGQHEGAKVWERLNLKNPSAKAVAFGWNRLYKICSVLAVDVPSDSATLHGKRLTVELDCSGAWPEIVDYAPTGPAPSKAAANTAATSDDDIPW